MKHVISALVENKVGVLAHIAGLFSGRGFNIDSLTVGITENPRFSRMTIVAGGDDAILEQIRKQLGKVIDVVKVQDLSLQDHVQRDLMMVKVNAPPAKRTEIAALVDVFRGNILDVSSKEMVIELSGDESKLEALTDLLRPYGVKELVRTGVVAMVRGERK